MTTISRWMAYVVVFGAVLICQVDTGHAQSLWRTRQPQRTNLVADTAARCVGDLVTILVRESTDVANSDQRNSDKASNSGFNFDFSSSTSVPASAEITGSAIRAFNGQSQYSVAQAFSDQITVEILDVLPNGNLVVGGQRQRIVAGERRTLVISGVIRTLDLSPNNTIASQYVANFNVSYDGEGPESKFTRQGWAGRVLTRFWPF